MGCQEGLACWCVWRFPAPSGRWRDGQPAPSPNTPGLASCFAPRICRRFQGPTFANKRPVLSCVSSKNIILYELIKSRTRLGLQAAQACSSREAPASRPPALSKRGKPFSLPPCPTSSCPSLLPAPRSERGGSAARREASEVGPARGRPALQLWDQRLGPGQFTKQWLFRVRSRVTVLPRKAQRASSQGAGQQAWPATLRVGVAVAGPCGRRITRAPLSP